MIPERLIVDFLGAKNVSEREETGFIAEHISFSHAASQPGKKSAQVITPIDFFLFPVIFACSP